VNGHAAFLQILSGCGLIHDLRERLKERLINGFGSAEMAA